MGKHKQGKTKHSDASRAATIREQAEAARRAETKQGTAPKVEPSEPQVEPAKPKP